MAKQIVVVMSEEGERHIETYFPNELAAMLVSHDVIAFCLPSYLRDQAL